jgi:type II secretory pathway pseudopilin PulG
MVELLISIVILGVLLVAVAGAMGNIFGLTQSAREGVNANTQARDLIENVRSQWTAAPGARAAYDANCFRASLPAGAAVSVGAVDPATGNHTPQTVSIVAPGGSCPSGSYNQPLKRVVVSISQGGRELSRLTLELQRP